MSLDNKPALRLRRYLLSNLLGLHVLVGVDPPGADDLGALGDVLREDGLDSLEGLPILPLGRHADVEQSTVCRIQLVQVDLLGSPR